MTRTSLYAVIGVLTAAVVALGIYLIVQEQQQPSLEITLDEQGLSIDGNG